MDDLDKKAAAADAPKNEPEKRGPGRPKGSSKKETVQVPPPLKLVQTGPPPLTPEQLDALLDDSLVRASNVPCLVFGLRPLEPHESHQVAGATKPVLIKYFGAVLSTVGPEIMLAFTLAAVYAPRIVERKSPPQKPADSRGGENGVGKNVPLQGAHPGGRPLASAGSDGGLEHGSAGVPIVESRSSGGTETPVADWTDAL